LKIAAVGDNCMDVYLNLGKSYPGGNPVNVAVYMKELNEISSYVGVVGNDTYGELMINSINSKGVDTSHVRVLEGATAITEVSLINGDRVMGDYYEGVLSRFELTNEDLDFICNHDLFHTAYWGKTENYLCHIKEKNIPISFDYATKLEDSLVHKTIHYVDYAFFSYSKRDDYIENFMKDIHSKGPKIVVVTLGNNGSVAYDGKEFIFQDIIETKVVDTLGAGDSFIAGFLKGILNKSSINESMLLGAKTASKTLKYFGAW